MPNNIKDTINDYLDRFRELDGTDVSRGLIIFAICFVLFFGPLFAIQHYGHQVNRYAGATKRNNAEAAYLIKQAHQKARYAKVQKKNQPQIQKMVEDKVNTFMKAQNTILAYQDKKGVSSIAKENANNTVNSLLKSEDLIGTTDGGKLIVPLGYGSTKNITMKVGYTPEYSVTQPSIHIMINTYYKKYLIYITDATFNIRSEKFTAFDTYFTYNSQAVGPGAYFDHQAPAPKKNNKKTDKKSKTSNKKIKEGQKKSKKTSKKKSDKKHAKKGGKKK